MELMFKGQIGAPEMHEYCGPISSVALLDAAGVESRTRDRLKENWAEFTSVGEKI